jgi:hypothetical protein
MGRLLVMRRAAARSIVLSAVTALGACVPADEAELLGSVSFTVRGTHSTSAGVDSARFVDGWEVRFGRVLVSFKTMTIGRVGESDVCAYRGRGARSDVVFDARYGIEQTFNGIRPDDCRDVGIVLGPPGAATEPADGAGPEDLFELAGDPPAFLLVEGSARRVDRTVGFSLRFDSARGPMQFGGCGGPERGVRIDGGERKHVVVEIAADALFHEGFSPFAVSRFAPFVDADNDGDGDGVVTMAELDALRLASVQRYSSLYQLPDGSTRGSFGDYVRALLRFSVRYGGTGGCVGNEPDAP